MAKPRRPQDSEGVNCDACADEESAIKRRVVALIVDDDEIARAALVRLLSACSIHALEADSRNAALDVLRAQDIDIVVCDQSLPLVCGLELLREIWSQFPRARRVLFTGDRDVTLLIEALDQCRVDFVLYKGTSAAELIAKFTYLRECVELARAKNIKASEQLR